MRNGKRPNRETSAQRSARIRGLKKKIYALVTRRRSELWNEAIAILAKEHPKGWCGYRWVNDALHGQPPKNRARAKGGA